MVYVLITLESEMLHTVVVAIKLTSQHYSVGEKITQMIKPHKIPEGGPQRKVVTFAFYPLRSLEVTFQWQSSYF